MLGKTWYDFLKAFRNLDKIKNQIRKLETQEQNLMNCLKEINNLKWNIELLLEDKRGKIKKLKEKIAPL